MAWGKAGSDTTTGADTAIRVSSMTASKFIQTMAFAISTSTQLVEEARVDNLSTSTYAQRHSVNGGSDGTVINHDAWAIHYRGTTSGTYFTVGYICNIDGEEKLRIHNRVERYTAGAGTAPERIEFVGKNTTTSQITDYQQFDDGGGSYYDTDSNLTALGSDITPAAAVTFPSDVPDYSRFEETDTRKMYSYLPPPAVTFEDDFSSYASQASADASWITNATNVRVNILTDKLGFAWTAGTPNQQCYYDLGASVSETEWVLRFVVNYSTLTSASAHLPVADIKMSGSSSSANYPLAASQISFQLSAGSGSANVYFKSTNTSGSGEVSPTAIAWNPTTGTDYYVEMIRTSATHATLNVRTGSHSGTMVTNFPMNLTSINSGCTGLRYLRLQQYPNSFGNITGTLGDVKFYNGVTSVVTTNSWKEKGTT